MQKCHLNEPRFNGVYSIKQFTYYKEWTHVTNLDEYDDI